MIFLDIEDNTGATFTLDELFNFYRSTFVPAYADLVGYIGDKPAQTLIELENTLAHISQYYDPNLPTGDKEQNLNKAYSHLTRATLDCYKSLWTEMNKDIKKINDDVYARALILNVPEEKFIREYQEFKSKAQIARSMELTNIGIHPLGSLHLYKETIEIGKNLVKYIDADNKQKYNTFRHLDKMREYFIGFVIGVASGLLANYIWNL
ncbi:hypothetical protein [Methanosarcina mazei]|uniref:Uncharacterized protein n=1 Tax=Methanosarcina mazei TaxID=2209 RepID=A0A0F8JQ62_METMZ|nr:hypothetical protein [Methanosarcina mazei]KKG52654.1 hypothetical protein DU33_08725 [Methanosarcina mazei]KKG63178.1 hypothetical protein DU64_06485 [Methanosarcina mazei]KKG65479.1 hypothetical protein DU45_07700 [Methanosarcina mazei]KKG96597.1 hypothetical protein DU66_08150 [Methanosarcina mazei]KKH01749.1 hypothetical protein DU68_08405 [Methanosarcina mazei]